MWYQSATRLLCAVAALVQVRQGRVVVEYPLICVFAFFTCAALANEAGGRRQQTVLMIILTDIVRTQKAVC